MSTPNTNTPRSDKATVIINDTAYVPLEVARQLELERNAMSAALSFYQYIKVAPEEKETKQ
jgi:hypothetical protein